MTDNVATQSLAAWVKIGDDGQPRLEGLRCNACGEVMVGEFRACPKCAAKGTLVPQELARTGKLYSYAIVHRSFPGVKTPIVSAAIKLDDGAFVRANLEGVAAEPAALSFDLPVRLEFDTLSGEHSSTAGGRLVRPVFRPMNSESGA